MVNAGSHTGERAYPEVLRLLGEAGVPLHSSYRLHDAARVPDVVRDLVATGCELLVLGGGDGTVSSVVDVLAGRETALGIVPLGPVAGALHRLSGAVPDRARPWTVAALGTCAALHMASQLFVLGHKLDGPRGGTRTERIADALAGWA